LQLDEQTHLFQQQRAQFLEERLDFEAFRANVQSQLRVGEERLKVMEAELQARERELEQRREVEAAHQKAQARELTYRETKLRHVEQAHKQLAPSIWGGEAPSSDPLAAALSQVEADAPKEGPQEPGEGGDDPFAAAMRGYQKG